MKLKIITTPTCGTKAGWVYDLPHGRYTTIAPCNVYHGIYQNVNKLIDAKHKNGYDVVWPIGTLVEVNAGGVYLTNKDISNTSFYAIKDKYNLENIIGGIVGS